MQKGHIHPISAIIREINDIFSEMGFAFAEGPIIESEHYNFDALNVPRNHPARDLQDTFWVRDPEGACLTTSGKSSASRDSQGVRDPEDGRNDIVLRTHTSPVQVRYMETNEPPIRIIVPGRAYRNEATDATHEAQFFQLEGLVVDTDVTLEHLKGTLETFFSKFFGQEVQIRFRPGYFPFVEPGVEVDVLYSSSRGTKWLELLGAGMVHPNVLKAGGIDPEKYQGFAFGVGIERLLSVRSEVDDIRLSHTGDLRFVNQF